MGESSRLTPGPFPSTACHPCCLPPPHTCIPLHLPLYSWATYPPACLHPPSTCPLVPALPPGPPFCLSHHSPRLCLPTAAYSPAPLQPQAWSMLLLQPLLGHVAATAVIVAPTGSQSWSSNHYCCCHEAGLGLDQPCTSCLGVEGK